MISRAIHGLWIAPLAWGAGLGCGSNDCDRAADHAAECHVATLNAKEGATSGTMSTPPDRVICGGTALCNDRCFLQASCDALNATGRDQQGEKAYADCIAGCQ